jgi:type VI secretion system secreted protein VgrG
VSTENVFELFTEVTGPGQLRPIAWQAEEELCGTFQLTVTAIAPVAVGDALASQLYGQRATFVAHGPSPLVRRGVISSVGIGGSDDVESVVLTLTVVPRLQLMSLRTTSRVFQNASPTEVLAAIAQDWMLPIELRLTKPYTKRSYLTQYRETDLDFLRRVASREGIGFFLEHAELGDERKKPGDEKLVFYDAAQAYPPIPPGKDPTRGHRLVHTRRALGPEEHHVGSMVLERRIAPEHVRLGDFDFKKPRLSLRASAGLPADRRSPINTSLGGERLSVYLHGDRAELDAQGGKAEISDEVAKVRLEQAQRDAVVGRGLSRCLRLSPGSTFELEEEAAATSLNQAYVVTRVSHRGALPEANREASEVYSNAFECVPASVVFRSALPALDLRQVTETATVIGPDGAEVHCDEHGRVQVRFHWDADASGASACWLRVLTTWAGPSWGSQFIPRVGMEVLVGFLSGDVDRPIVLGSVYNGTHPTPFALPAEAAKAGFKTSSTPGGEGGSELTFDDTKGQERFVLKGERDMTLVAYNDFDLQVGRNEAVLVEGASERTVNGDASTRVLGGRVESTKADATETVGGSALLSVGANLDVRVTGNRTLRVEGKEQSELGGDVSSVVKQDLTERILGHRVTIVGEHDARRSATVHVEGSSHQFATGTHELVSDKEIVLRCGDSSLRLTPDGLDIVVDRVRLVGRALEGELEESIQLFSKKALALVSETFDVRAEKRVVLEGDGATLKLRKDARLDGAVVKLNCDPEPPDPLEPPPYEPPEKTTIELLDEAGRPLGRRRYVITDPDGSERTGVLDQDGRAEVYLEQASDVVFPDVDGARRG